MPCVLNRLLLSIDRRQSGLEAMDTVLLADEYKKRLDANNSRVRVLGIDLSGDPYVQTRPLGAYLKHWCDSVGWRCGRAVASSQNSEGEGLEACNAPVRGTPPPDLVP